jgi:hypothetical protein
MIDSRHLGQRGKVAMVLIVSHDDGEWNRME